MTEIQIFTFCMSCECAEEQQNLLCPVQWDCRAGLDFAASLREKCLAKLKENEAGQVRGWKLFACKPFVLERCIAHACAVIDFNSFAP